MNKDKKTPESSNSQKKNEKPKTKTTESEQSILSLFTKPIFLLFNSVVSLIGFDSFFGVGIMIFLIFMLSYSLRILFSGTGKPAEKRKKINPNKEVKKEN